MKPEHTGPHARFTPVYLISILVLFQLFIALFTNTLTLTHEESMWHYIGRNWLQHGLTPYSGGIDNKSPLIFLVFGISDSLFGINYWFPRLLGTVVESVGILYIYKIAKRLAGEQAGILAISIYGLSLLWKVTGGKLVSFTETYATTCIIYSFYKCLIAGNKKDYFIAGLFAGLGIAFRITAIFSIIALLVLCIRKKITSTAALIGGAICSCALLLLLAIAEGMDVTAILQHTLTDNFGAGSITDHTLTWKIKGFVNNFLLSELILFIPFVVGYIIIKPKADILLIWAAFTFLGINLLGVYARPHFKELLPPLSLIAGITLTHLVAVRKINFKTIVIIVWIIFFPKVLEPYWGVKKWLNPPTVNPGSYCTAGSVQASEDAEKYLGLWIKANTKETDRVYIAGFSARVQTFSERLSPVTYFNVTQTDKAKEILFKELRLTPPAMIVIPVFDNYRKYVENDIRLSVDSLITQYYSFSQCLYGYNIYNFTSPLIRAGR